MQVRDHRTHFIRAKLHFPLEKSLLIPKSMYLTCSVKRLEQLIRNESV